MCRKVVYPKGDRTVRMDVKNGKLFFSAYDITSCMGYCNTHFYHFVIRDEEVDRIERTNTKGTVIAISEEVIRRIIKNGRKDFTDFLPWFDEICEQYRPEPVIETPAPMPVENTEHNFDKEKMKAFFEGAAEFFNMCSKMIA